MKGFGGVYEMTDVDTPEGAAQTTVPGAPKPRRSKQTRGITAIPFNLDGVNSQAEDSKGGLSLQI